MSTDNKPETLNFISPRATVRYPRLLKPDTGPKNNPTKPKFTVKGIFKPGEGEFIVGKTKLTYAEVVKKLESMRDAEYDVQLAAIEDKKKGKQLKDAVDKLHKVDVFVPEYDADGNETGNVTLNAKTAAEYKDKKTGELVQKKPPLMFDSKGKKIEGKLPPVGGGSVMKISVSAKAYYVESSGAVGITCYLNSTQLIKLVEFGGGSNPGFGDEGEDGGYDASDAAEEEGGGYGEEVGKAAASSDGNF